MAFWSSGRSINVLKNLFKSTFTTQEDGQKLTLDNSPLAQVSEVEVLGVIFDQALTFRSHIDYVIDRCKSSLNLNSTDWGWGGGGGGADIYLQCLCGLNFYYTEPQPSVVPNQKHWLVWMLSNLRFVKL